MTIPDNGLPGKKFIFLVVDYKLLNGTKEFTSGLSNEFSSKGLLIETQSSEISPGDSLEMVLKDPHKDLNVNVSGDVISIKAGWYKSVIEVGFKGLDKELENELMKLISGLEDNSDAGLMPDNGDSGKEKAVEVKKEEQLSDKKYLTEAVAKISISSERENRHNYAGPKKVKKAEQVKKKIRLWPWVAMLFAFLSVLGITGSRYLNEIEKMIIEPVPVTSNEMVEMLPPVSDVLLVDEGLKVIGGNDDADVSPDLTEAPVKVEEPVNVSIAETSFDNKDNENAVVNDVPQTKNMLLSFKEKKEHISTVAEVTFGTDSDVVAPDFYSAIDRIANAVTDQAGMVVKIEGHTDDVGPEIYNIDLSLRRALAVKKLLNQRGIGKHQVKIEVLGDSVPVTSNDTVSGRRKNRRVVIRTIPPEA